MNVLVQEPQNQAETVPLPLPVTLSRSALIAPRLSLSSCVRAYVTRSTVGAELRPDQRRNHFPATPLCCITWLLEGDSTLIRRGDECVSEPVPRVSFSGPHTLPCESVNSGQVEALMLVLTPQAVRAMAGVDIAAFVNRVAPISAVFDGPWLAMVQAVHEAPGDAARVQLIEAFLEPRWRDMRQDAMPTIDRYRYWVEGLALWVGTAGVGKSLRQIERRIKQWAGLPLRDLRRLARAEESFFLARDDFVLDTPKGGPDWSAIAADTGFADQSHLCRESRRISGLSPNELKKAIGEDESYWVYRIWE